MGGGGAAAGGEQEEERRGSPCIAQPPAELMSDCRNGKQAVSNRLLTQYVSEASRQPAIASDISTEQTTKLPLFASIVYSATILPVSCFFHSFPFGLTYIRRSTMDIKLKTRTREIFDLIDERFRVKF